MISLFMRSRLAAATVPVSPAVPVSTAARGRLHDGNIHRADDVAVADRAATLNHSVLAPCVKPAKAKRDGIMTNIMKGGLAMIGTSPLMACIRESATPAERTGDIIKFSLIGVFMVGILTFGIIRHLRIRPKVDARNIEKAIDGGRWQDIIYALNNHTMPVHIHAIQEAIVKRDRSTIPGNVYVEVVKTQGSVEHARAAFAELTKKKELDAPTMVRKLINIMTSSYGQAYIDDDVLAVIASEALRNGRDKLSSDQLVSMSELPISFDEKMQTLDLLEERVKEEGPSTSLFYLTEAVHNVAMECSPEQAEKIYERYFS